MGNSFINLFLVSSFLLNEKAEPLSIWLTKIFSLFVIDHSDLNFEGKWCCDQSQGCGLCLKRWSFMEIFKYK